MADISVLEQWLVELINRVRLDPAGTLGAQLNEGLVPGTLTGEARQALAHSDILQATSSFHNNWMLENGVLDTKGEAGSRPGDRIEYAGYPTDGDWIWAETINWRGFPPGSSLFYEFVASSLFEALIADPELRQLMLLPTLAEVGVSQLFGDHTLNGAAWYAGLLTIDYAATEGGRYITGMAFYETLPDWTHSPKQGYAGIAVEGIDESTVTRSAGGYDILATSDNQVVTIGGITVSLVMPDGNVKLDLISRNTIASSHTMTVVSGAASARLLGGADEGLFAADTAGAVSLQGNTGANRLVGNVLGNRIDGGEGADRMEGGQGNDVYIVDNAKDRIVELRGHGNDTVKSFVSYVLTAGAEVEVLETDQSIFTTPINLTGNEFGQIIRGNHGNNVIDGGKGIDKMYGWNGDDQYVVSTVGDQVFEWAGEGTDHVLSYVDFSLAGQDLEHLTLTGEARSGTGNNLNNTIIGNSGNNVLDGASGADHLYGGQGSDTYIVDNLGDRVYEAVNSGTDTVSSSVSFSLSAQHIENLSLTGTANIDAKGNGLDNIIVGNDGNNRLDGGGGADKLNGGLGDDTYIIDNIRDRPYEAANKGIDIVLSSVSFSLSGSHIERLTLTGSADINATGNGQANLLTGNSGDNVIAGGLSRDTLFGGIGVDHFVFDTALSTRNVDTILDFTKGRDKILLDRDIFSAFKADGALAYSAFKTFRLGPWIPPTECCSTPIPGTFLMTPTAMAVAPPFASRPSPMALR